MLHECNVCMCNDFRQHSDISIQQRRCTGLNKYTTVFPLFVASSAVWLLNPSWHWLLVYWETWISLDWNESRQKNKALCTCCSIFPSVCVLVFVCLTSVTAFFFCSLTPRFSRLRLASKHSGHTRLVLLSKVFEHFAQMACRRTGRERETALRSRSVVNS